MGYNHAIYVGKSLSDKRGINPIARIFEIILPITVILFYLLPL